MIDDPELMHGAPVAIQIVGSRLEDQQLLAHAELLDSILNGQ